MKHSPIHLIICASATLLTVACSTGGPKVDVGWIGESVSSPQNDTVINESGRSLPMLSVQQAAPQEPAPTAVGQPSRWGSFMSQIQQQPAAQSGAPTASVQPVMQTPQVAATRTYTVQQGDTLSSIAARHGVSTSALISLNGLAANPNALRIGQVLQVPGAATAASMPMQSVPTSPTVASTASSYRTYTVVAGDTLSGIAARNGTTVSAIMAINGFTPAHANRIRVGQTIKLPSNR